MWSAPIPENFKPGDPWKGVVMIERPDVSKLSQDAEPMCRVMSARTVQLNGHRVIGERMPYSMFKHYFTVLDGDHVFVEAEYKAGHLEFYGRSNRQEWVMFSMTEAQAGGKLYSGYH